MNIFSQIIDIFGSQAKAAEMLNLKSRQVLGNWKARGCIPPRHFHQIVELSGGRITYEDLYQSMQGAQRESEAENFRSP